MSERLQTVFWIVVVVFAIVFLAYNYTARASEPFDHTQCQYPDRLSNPPDGCDNTDPARPECMKVGTEDCSIPKPVEQVPEPTKAENVAPAPSHAVEAAPEPEVFADDLTFVGK